MTDIEQKKIFAKNLNHYLSISNKSQREVANDIGVSPQTFNTWCQAIAIPRMGKVQKLADYFHINKTDLIDEPKETTLTTKDKRDIKKDLDTIMKKLKSGEDGPASYNGEELDPEAADLFRDELEIALRRLKIINKKNTLLRNIKSR